jgi:membrane protein implicated in regulation of membrane protease activity
MEWLVSQLSIWMMWFILAFGLLIAEFTLAGFVALFFAVGAGLAGIVAIFTPNLSVQVTVMLIASVIGIVLGRQVLIDRFGVNEDVIRTNVDAMIGNQAIVTKTISPTEKGIVKYGGQSWTAASVGNRTFAEGEMVVIYEIQGVTLFVDKQ